MHIVVCQCCKKEVWKCLETPQVGKPLKAEAFSGINGYPSPHPLKSATCPACGRSPFIIHNFGIQMLTNEGELLPCLPNLEGATFLLPQTD